jgi:L,D-peptidoglycan transpeptidase YkuD (ErfK/YbiS/YcfS/YnhG family)
VTARGRHTLGAALVSGALVVALLAVAYFTAGPRGARPANSAAAGAPAAAGTTTTEAGRARPGAPAPGGAAATTPATTASGGARAGDGAGGRPPIVESVTGSGGVHAPAGNAAQRLRTLPPETRQVVIVSTDGFASNTAVLETFTKVGQRWQVAFAPMPARIGSAGFADRKAEGDLKTPTGVYAIGDTMYGIRPDPGVRYGYHRVVQDDWWNENPASPGYNTFFHGANPGGASEALWTYDPQYRYFAVINYNIPVVPANPPLGSGIFLHVVNPGKATAGCVSLAESDLLAVLRWLDPASAPRMVLAPRTVLSRY